MEGEAGALVELGVFEFRGPWGLGVDGGGGGEGVPFRVAGCVNEGGEDEVGGRVDGGAAGSGEDGRFVGDEDGGESCGWRPAWRIGHDGGKGKNCIEEGNILIGYIYKKRGKKYSKVR